MCDLQASGSAIAATASWDPERTFQAYWDHVKTHSSDTHSGTRSKAPLQQPVYPWMTPATSAVHGAHEQGQKAVAGANAWPHSASSLSSSAPSEPHPELVQSQSESSRAQSQAHKVHWSQQPLMLNSPPLQAYQTEQGLQIAGPAYAEGALSAAQQLSAHDGKRRNWAPGAPLHVTWHEDPSFIPTQQPGASSAASLASYRSAARSILSGTAVREFPPAAGAQLPVAMQPHPAAPMAPPSMPATPRLPVPSRVAAVRSPCSAVGAPDRAMREVRPMSSRVASTALDIAGACVSRTCDTAACCVRAVRWPRLHTVFCCAHLSSAKVFPTRATHQTHMVTGVCDAVQRQSCLPGRHP